MKNRSAMMVLFLAAGCGAAAAQETQGSGVLCSDLLAMDQTSQAAFLEGYVAAIDEALPTEGSADADAPAAEADADMENSDPAAGANETGPAGGPSGGPIGRDPASLSEACAGSPGLSLSTVIRSAVAH